MPLSIEFANGFLEKLRFGPLRRAALFSNSNRSMRFQHDFSYMFLVLLFTALLRH